MFTKSRTTLSPFKPRAPLSDRSGTSLFHMGCSSSGNLPSPGTKCRNVTESESKLTYCIPVPVPHRTQNSKRFNETPLLRTLDIQNSLFDYLRVRVLLLKILPFTRYKTFHKKIQIIKHPLLPRPSLYDFLRILNLYVYSCVRL